MMEQYKDYYKVMGLEKTASPEEIKRSYRKLARKYHPDVSKEPNAEEHFKELGEAYEVLKDPEKRAKYDQYGEYWKSQGQRAEQGFHSQQAGGQRYQHFEESDMAGFEDFINSIFGQRQAQYQHRHQRPSHVNQGQDIHAKLTIDLDDSYHGTEKTLQLQTPSIDQHGNPSNESRSIRVKIPKGIGDSQQIRLKGQGVKVHGGRAGDLYIEIHIAPHPYFRLQDKNIYVKLPILPWEAALGATVQIPTLGGTVNLKIPKQSQAGTQMRLKGRGLPGSPAGDQYVVFEIVNPPSCNEELIKLYEEMATKNQFNPREAIGVHHG
jgi:curved DNA-binding protein